MPITSARTWPSPGPRSTIGCAAAAVVTHTNAVHARRKARTRDFMAQPSVSFAPPFDAAVQAIHVLLRETGGVVELDRFVRALADGFNRGVDPVFAQERRDRFGARVGERHVGLGGATHVRVTDQLDAIRLLLLDG